MLLCHILGGTEFGLLCFTFLTSLFLPNTQQSGKCITLSSYINWVLDLPLTPCLFPPPCLLQDVLLMGEDLVSEPYYCQLEAETCRLFSEQLGTLALVGESLHMGAAKRLRLVLFSDAYCSTLEYNIRVYCMDDTQDVFKVNCDKCSPACHSVGQAVSQPEIAWMEHFCAIRAGGRLRLMCDSIIFQYCRLDYTMCVKVCMICGAGV